MTRKLYTEIQRLTMIDGVLYWRPVDDRPVWRVHVFYLDYQSLVNGLVERYRELVRVIRGRNMTN